MGEGDSTVSVFESAPQALTAAIAATRALADEPWPDGLARSRSASGCTPARPSDADADYFGPTLNLAARCAGRPTAGRCFLSSHDGSAGRRTPPGGYDAGRPRSPSAARAARARDRPRDPGPGRDRAAARRRSARTAGCWRSSPTTAGSSSGARSVVEDGARPARAGPAARRGGRLGEREVLAAARGRRRGGARRRGRSASTARPLLHARPGAVLEVGRRRDARRRRPVRGAVHAVRRPRRAATPSSTQLLAHSRPWRSGCAPTSTGAERSRRARSRGGRQPGPARCDERRRARARDDRARAPRGLRLEPGLVDLILRDVAREPGALPLLSHALRVTWERRDGRTLTVEGYRDERRCRVGDRADGGRRRRDAASRPPRADTQPVPAADRARRRDRGHASPGRGRRARPRGRLAR